MPEPFSLKPTPAPAPNLFGVPDVAPEAGAKKARAKKAAAPATAIGSTGLDPNLPPNLGQPLKVEVPDFSDPNRPKTCLEIDFPLVPINALSALEGNAGKPIYQMSKWWARRRSCVFRALLLAAAMKAPVRRHPDGQPMLGPDGQPIIDEDSVDRAVWDAYYANHQAAENFKHLKVLDPFMGGGTTLVEGSRLGFQVAGVDLNPVAWFIVKNELACTDPAQVKTFFDQIEAEVKPQIQPFYVTDGVGGKRGCWVKVQPATEPDGAAAETPMPDGFDPASLPPAERKHYRYEGPEVIYTFWAKHGPCAKPGCGHRTPIFRSPVVATKKLGVKYLECTCKNKACALRFHAELGDARIAPDAEQVILGNEQAYTVVSQPFAQALLNYERDGREVLDARIEFLTTHLETEPGLKCPACGQFAGQFVRDILAKHKAASTYASIKKKDFSILPSGQGKKPVYCTLLIDPEWLKGSPGEIESASAASASARPSSAMSGTAAPGAGATPYTAELGGYIDAPIDATAAWYRERLQNLRLIEVRGQCAAGEDPGNGFPTPIPGSQGRGAGGTASSAPASASSGTRSNSSGASSGPSGTSSGPLGGSSESSGRSSGQVGTSSGWAGRSSSSSGLSSKSAGTPSNPSGGSSDSAGGKRGGAPEGNAASAEASEGGAGGDGGEPGLPLMLTLRDGRRISTRAETIARKANGKEWDSHFVCGACGTPQDFRLSVQRTRRTAPVMAYAIQAYDAERDASGTPYGGRYFAAPSAADVDRMVAAEREWASRKDTDLSGFWPREEMPVTYMTHQANFALPEQGYTHWYKMFNPRQLVVHAALLKAIGTLGTSVSVGVREAGIAAHQQYLQNHSMFCHYEVGWDKLAVTFANSNFRPRTQPLENNFIASMGRGNWPSCASGVIEGLAWAKEPEDTYLDAGGESQKAQMSDPVLPGAALSCRSSTDMADADKSFDLVITDPPFGDNIYYSDLSNFFYAWLRLPLKDTYPEQFGPTKTPSAQEALKPRSLPDAEGDKHYFDRLTPCWAEACRVMKDGGIMAFTFHHSEDAQWEIVLRSLFDAGFYLEATYPIASDEMKGAGGQFGAKGTEYDIIHVCRKRLHEPKPVSWPKMRQWVKAELARLRPLLESYKSRGLSDADVRVILRGKALEFYSRHYGKVLVAAPGGTDGALAEVSLSIRDALLGINMLLDESSSDPGAGTRPPSIVQPVVYQYLRLFGAKASYSRDEVSKLLRGTTVQQAAFEKTNSSGGAWVVEEDKVVRRATIRERFAKMKARSRREMKSELDQAQFLIGAAFEGSGVNIEEEFQRHTFLIRPGVEALLDWFGKTPAGKDEPDVPRAAALALSLFRAAKEARIIRMRTDGQQKLFEDDVQNEEWESAAV